MPIALLLNSFDLHVLIFQGCLIALALPCPCTGPTITTIFVAEIHLAFQAYDEGVVEGDHFVNIEHEFLRGSDENGKPVFSDAGSVKVQISVRPHHI